MRISFCFVFKKAKIKTTTKLTYVIKNLKKGKTYYVRIDASKNVKVNKKSKTFKNTQYYTWKVKVK